MQAWGLAHALFCMSGWQGLTPGDASKRGGETTYVVKQPPASVATSLLPERRNAQRPTCAIALVGDEMDFFQPECQLVETRLRGIVGQAAMELDLRDAHCSAQMLGNSNADLVRLRSVWL